MSTRVDRPSRAGKASPVETKANSGITLIPESPHPATLRAKFDAWTHRAAAVAEPVWRDRRISVAVTFGAGALWGAGAGWWTPRGPLTTSHAVWAILISLLVGTAAGLAARSRWAVLASPIAFAAMFEFIRMGTDGPTVDVLSASTYGLIALIVGRGFHATVSLFPLAFGAVIGAGIAHRLSAHPRSGEATGRRSTFARRGIAIVAALGLVAFTTMLIRPASTDPIVDAVGAEIPGSLAELTTIEVNGHDLALMIRGHSIHNPVLLFLAGGPGGSELGAMRNHLSQLEEHVTVVTWDQRGAGKSYPALDPTHTITLDGYVRDTIVVTDYLRNRFGQDRIFLLGQSWGTTLGVLAVQQHPDRYHAFIGTGQMVSQLATDTIFYQDSLTWAQSTGRTGLVADLLAIGAPPYDDMLDYELALASEQDVYAYDHTPNAEGEGQMSENLFVEEYSLIDQIHILGAFMDTFAVLYQQLQDIDFRDTATTFEIPVFFVQGAFEAEGRARPFAEWYPLVQAPIKDLVILDTSGHRPLFEQPDEFVAYMTDTVLAQNGGDR